LGICDDDTVGGGGEASVHDREQDAVAWVEQLM